MKSSFKYRQKHCLAGNAIESIIWLLLGITALGVVGFKVVEYKKNEPPKPIEVMVVESDPAKLEPLIKDFLAKEHPDATFVEIGDFGVLRGHRYIGAKIKANKEASIEDWIFSGPDDTITFGESLTMIIRRLQQDADRSKNYSRFTGEQSQLRKMAKMN